MNFNRSEVFYRLNYYLKLKKKTVVQGSPDRQSLF
jgi:hypothetical protein